MIYSQDMNVDITFLVATAAALYGIWKIYRATNRIHSCKVVIDDDNSKVDNLNVNVKDGLSELPDVVLLDILSYMSLRDVTRMAMLSRRWRNLCLTIPSLDLDWFVLSGIPSQCHARTCDEFCYKQAYVKSVDQVLQKYRGQRILSFSLVCCLDNNYADDVERWINFAAANKGLQSLTLQFICVDRFRTYFQSHCKGLHLISCSFLSQFSYLRELRLDSCILKLENDFILSTNLTTLHLTNVTLEGKGIQWLDFLSSCSTIECLRLRMCNLPDKLGIGNDFPRLRSLSIGECPSLQEFELSAKNLKKLEIYQEEPLKCSYKNVSNLESVYMFPDSAGAEDMLKCLAAEAKIKYLILRGVEPLVNKLPFSPHKTFHTVLKLYISSVNDDGSIVSALPCLLKSFPLLEKLEMRFPNSPVRQSCELPIPYVHKNLKEVKLANFKLEWIPVAIYLLQSVFMLDCMMITKSSKVYYGSESWNWNIARGEFNLKERILILNSLIGKASSTSARVTIE